MPPKTEKANRCGWVDCTNKAEAAIHLDAGSKVCGECGTEVTSRRTYQLCASHNDQHTESGDVTLLMLSAKEAS